MRVLAVLFGVERDGNAITSADSAIVGDVFAGLSVGASLARNCAVLFTKHGNRPILRRRGDWRGMNEEGSRRQGRLLLRYSC